MRILHPTALRPVGAGREFEQATTKHPLSPRNQGMAALIQSRIAIGKTTLGNCPREAEVSLSRAAR
jgi:hypothetical protein